ncbi:MAG TPA: DUF4097 family beta strand repeat-containing protein [Vicinamibacterales bacterium]|nr:DUF4097 family beta strand repeat-containing protein [Vicinamibacterales bacterium]
MTTRLVRQVVGSAFAAACLLLLGGCGLQLSLNAEAHDQWKKSYKLAQGGSFEIRNTNGRMQIRTGDTDAVDVVADRSVRAGSDEGAKDALRRMEISETVSPDRILLDATGGGMGLQINISKKVDFVVTLPRWAAVKLVSTNGDIEVTDLTGVLTVETTNGRVRATGLGNGAKVESTNGAITLDFTKVADAGITCEATNGAIQVTIPSDSKASISARVSNGTIVTKSLNLAATEQSRRRLDASIGGGGPSIRLTTTNGLIELKGR